MKNVFLVVTLIIIASCQQQNNGFFNVLDYGAKGDS